MESDHIMLAVFQLPWRSLLLLALTAWLAAELEGTGYATVGCQGRR